MLAALPERQRHDQCVYKELNSVVKQDLFDDIVQMTRTGLRFLNKSDPDGLLCLSLSAQQRHKQPYFGTNDFTFATVEILD